MIEINNILDIDKLNIKGNKVFIFDLDDTLYSEKEYVRSGYYKIAEYLQDKSVAEKLWKEFLNKKNAIDEVLMNEGVFTEKLKQECLEVYRNQLPDIHLYEGVKDMLAKLKNRGYMLGLITDGRSEGQRHKIKALDIEKCFDYIIVTDELGGVEYRKPNEKAYTMMKDEFEVNYSEMCYIGDNINKDFIAPQKLGMKSIYFKNLEGLYYKNLYEY